MSADWPVLITYKDKPIEELTRDEMIMSLRHLAKMLDPFRSATQIDIPADPYVMACERLIKRVKDLEAELLEVKQKSQYTQEA